MRNKLSEFAVNVIFILDVEMSWFPPWETASYPFGAILIFCLDLPVSCPSICVIPPLPAHSGGPHRELISFSFLCTLHLESVNLSDTDLLLAFLSFDFLGLLLSLCSEALPSVRMAYEDEGKAGKTQALCHGLGFFSVKEMSSWLSELNP